jgi:hypothetical protein
VTRRPVLPGASELFRRTDTPPAPPEVTELPNISTTTSSPALRGGAQKATDSAGLTLVPGGAAPGAEDDDQLAAFRAQPVVSPRHPSRGRPARRAERTKHDEKITVYISADDLVALESARLSLRAQYGVAADRGRIVREAVSVLLADLAERGEESVLVQRLRGR